MKKILLSCLIVLFLSACVEEPQSSTQNGNFVVEFLFTQDGCNVYRFKDGDEYIYWANCNGQLHKEVYHQTGKTGYTERMTSFTTDK